MLRKLFFIGCLLFLVAVQTKAQEELNPVKWSLKSEKAVETLKSGDEFKAFLSAKIEKGWHLYALEKIDGGPIPTKVSVAEDAPFELGKIEVPEPIEVDDSAFGITTKFYENDVKFNLPLKVLSSFESGKSELKIKIRFQMCNDQMCLPPKTAIVSLDSEKSLPDN